MPLPVVPIVIATAAAAGFGIKKGTEAIRDQKKTHRKAEDAKKIYSAAERKLKNERKATASELEKLGNLKLSVWHNEIGRFVQLFEKIKRIHRIELATSDENNLQNIQRNKLETTRNLSLKASDVVVSGGAAIGSGAIIGIASYGGAMMFGTASTGTAIGTLSGVAASNATLAWFGGGSLVAGGAGMAGGILVLGGLAAAPVLAVGGMVLSAKARKNLANAKANYAKAEHAVEEMKNANAILRSIKRVAMSYSKIIEKMRSRLTIILDHFENIIHTAEHQIPLLCKIPWFGKRVFTHKTGTNYSNYNQEQKEVVHLSVLFAQTMMLLLEAPLLTKKRCFKKGLN